MPVNTCRLCLEERELRQSHIIPNAYFRSMKRGSNGLVVRIVDDGITPIEHTNDSWSEPMLCASCERHFGRWETTWIKRLRDTARKFEYLETTLPVEKFDYKTLRLFLLSILWRASVSLQMPFDQVDLGKHAEPLREALLHDQPLDERMYGIRLRKLVDVSGKYTAVWFDGLARSPAKFAEGRLTGFRFIFAGYVVDYLCPRATNRESRMVDSFATDRCLRSRLSRCSEFANSSFPFRTPSASTSVRSTHRLKTRPTLRPPDLWRSRESSEHPMPTPGRRRRPSALLSLSHFSCRPRLAEPTHQPHTTVPLAHRSCSDTWSPLRHQQSGSVLVQLLARPFRFYHPALCKQEFPRAETPDNRYRPRLDHQKTGCFRHHARFGGGR